MQMPQGASPGVGQRSVRYGYHWGVARQIDRIGKGLHQRQEVQGELLYLKALCSPLADEEFEKRWKEVKEDHQRLLTAIHKEVIHLPVKSVILSLRWRQLELLIQLLWDNQVLVDEGIPYENIEVIGDL